jgi:hypothetical protein
MLFMLFIFLLVIAQDVRVSGWQAAAGWRLGGELPVMPGQGARDNVTTVMLCYVVLLCALPVLHKACVFQTPSWWASSGWVAAGGRATCHARTRCA